MFFFAQFYIMNPPGNLYIPSIQLSGTLENCLNILLIWIFLYYIFSFMLPRSKTIVSIGTRILNIKLLKWCTYFKVGVPKFVYNFGHIIQKEIIIKRKKLTLPNESMYIEEGTWEAWLPTDLQVGPRELDLGNRRLLTLSLSLDVHSSHSSGFRSNFKDTDLRKLGGVDTIWTLYVLSS